MQVRLTPRARRAAIGAVEDDAAGQARLRVSVTAPPEDGKANAALIALLAKAWRLPKSALTIDLGATGRNKIVHVAGDPARLLPALAGWLEAGRG